MKHTLPIKHASSFYARMRGLMLRKTFSGTLALIHCRAIHTFFMRFSIDVVCCDSDGTVIAVKRNLKPWRVFIAPGRTTVMIECMAGDHSLERCMVGDHIETERIHD